MTISVFR